VIAIVLGALAVAVGGITAWQYLHGHRDFFIIAKSPHSEAATSTRPPFTTTPLPFVTALLGTALIALSVGLHVREQCREEKAMRHLQTLGVGFSQTLENTNTSDHQRK
jgi:hypothetical protein